MKKTRRNCLISGGSRGIGLTIVTQLARLGYNIATFARTQNQVDALRGKMAEFDISLLAEVGDIRDDQFLQGFVQKTAESFGGIDLLINNAGGGKKAAVLEANLEDWDQILATNLRGAMVLTKFCMPELLKTQNATVINIASMAAKSGIATSSAYCASKFGLLGFSHALFEEVREQGIKVCAICPGYVDTPLIPSRKSLMREEMIQAEDIAKTVEYILGLSASACPVEILIRPQRYPFRT